MTHPTGLSVVLDPFSQRSTLSVQCWIKTGSLYEKNHPKGIAHFLEHMLFTGSQDKSNQEMINALSHCGGQSNAFTSFDHTVFESTVPIDFYQSAFSHLGEVVLDPVFSNDQLEKEKKIIIEEFLESKDQDDVVFEESFWEKVYGDQFLGSPILGSKKSIESTSVKDLNSFYQTHYQPQNMVLSVCGNLTQQQFNDALEEFVSHASASDTRSIDIDARYSFQSASFSFHRSKHKRKIQVLFPVPHYLHPDTIALEILVDYLGGGEHSLLYQRLFKDLQWVLEVQAHVLQTTFGGHIQIDLVPVKDKEQDCLDKLMDILQSDFLAGLTDQKLKWIQNDLSLDIMGGIDTTWGRAQINGYFETLLGGANAQFQYVDNLFALGKTDLERVKKKYFDHIKPAIAIWSPEV